ncbi:helix-turn-helix transcriptional regulator [Phototrophicus methaneseepsis]|uniref:Helix-turn-helix transcriptional regulator n=1 Tax=Phototrophicus methaneseepsis TaxID=2710758 RepID=A0A7S8IEV5_9CHLR|nr:PadR family transcriptional regulator [Phototrophicus methaneseepsis]QPC82981.1 helix-turn-helix transcriptional regulator [Phototrophicus methaneseepsis]
MPHEALTEPTFYILAALAPQANHGYAIMQEVEALSNGRVTLSTGTLYTALKRLLEAGWIEDVTPENTPRGRKDYRLTPTGRAVLEAEMQRLSELAALARRKLKENPL